jgi:hypothetical protein
MKLNKIVLSFLACLFGILLAGKVFASGSITPKIVELRNNTINSDIQKVEISGLTVSGTEVLIYLDGSYAGLAKVKDSNTATDSFYFSGLSILKTGQHQIFAVARDRTSLLLSPPTEEITFSATQKPLPAPTIISPNKKTITSDQKPAISGFTTSQSFVRVYIDGIYDGKTSVLKHRSGTAYFSYKPFLKLKRGWHKYSVVAEFANGRKSQTSFGEFNIEYPMPAPTLLKTVENKMATTSPFAVGLAKNNSRILVYVDNRFDGSFLVKNHISGTANFAYSIKKKLGRGTHKIYAKARDSRGKTSIWSKSLYYKAMEPNISTAAYEENKTLDGNNGQTLKVEVKKPAANKSAPAVTGNNQAIDQEVQKILDDSKLTGTTTAPGSLDENNSSQNKLKTNIIIFILLLLGIIGWIVWVNREIVKERSDTDKKDNLPKST